MATPAAAGQFPSYSAVYRRTDVAIPVLLAAFASFFTLLGWAFVSIDDAYTILFVVLGSAAFTILITLFLLMSVFRVHCWTLEETGIRVVERPKFRFTARAKKAFAPWNEIVALRRIESGFDRQIEIEMRGGALYRMGRRTLTPDGGGLPLEDESGFSSLAATISARLATAGVAVPGAQEGLSFWNRVPGIAILGLLFLVTVVIAAGAVIAVWSGAYLYGAVLKGGVLVLLLPLGAGYLLFRSLKRRRRVVNRP